jgi:hypothetical protein
MTHQITRIKEKVEEQSGVPPQQQRLIFSGRQLYVNTFQIPIHLVSSLARSTGFFLGFFFPWLLFCYPEGKVP